MATKNNPGDYDCYTNAEPDEPMFVLLGRDRHAPTLVWLWSVLRELDQEDEKKVKDARDCVVNMVAWAHERGKKTVGLGQAVLAGVMDMIRQTNVAVTELDRKPGNEPTDHEFMRRLLSRTTFEDQPADTTG